MGEQTDELEKEVEEMRAAWKASQSWTNHWANKIKEVGSKLASYWEDWLNLLSQQLDFGADIRTNSWLIAEMENRLAQQETRMVSLLQRLEHAEVGIFGPYHLEPTNTLLAGRLSLWLGCGGQWVAEPDLRFVRH